MTGKSKALRRRVAAGTSAIALLLTMSAAYADTSVLGYGGPGNVLNPNGQPIDLQRDLDGLSQLDDVTRTPTGLLYPLPYAYPAMTQSKSDPDIWTTGWIEGGLLGTFGQRINSAAFSEYTDWSNGPIVTSLGFLTENRKTAWYLSGLAEDVGRSDEYYQLKTGRYGVFNVTAMFDSIPHIYSTEAKSLWNGVGSNDLTLRGGLVPGSSTAAQVDSVLATVAPTELKVTREKEHVVTARAQRWNQNLDHGESVVEVLTERSVVDRLRERAIRRGDDAHVHLVRDVRAHRTDLPRFEEPQELRL